MTCVVLRFKLSGLAHRPNATLRFTAGSRALALSNDEAIIPQSGQLSMGTMVEMLMSSRIQKTAQARAKSKSPSRPVSTSFGAGIASLQPRNATLECGNPSRWALLASLNRAEC